MLAAVIALCLMAYRMLSLYQRLLPRPVLRHKEENGENGKKHQVINGSSSQEHIHDTGLHPIWYLIKDSQQEFDAMNMRQSETLRDVVMEYRRRYSIPPPPHFDK